MIYTFQNGDQTVTLNLESAPGGGYKAAIGDRVLMVQVQSLADGGWLLRLDGQQVIVYSAAQGNTRFVSAEGHHYTLTIPDVRTHRRSAAGGGDLTAPMPGKVVAALVSDHDPVQKGQTLVILEAMKMEIRITAPADGRVKRLLVHQGDVVERGQLLLEIEPANL